LSTRTSVRANRLFTQATCRNELRTIPSTSNLGALWQAAFDEADLSYFVNEHPMFTANELA